MINKLSLKIWHILGPAGIPREAALKVIPDLKKLILGETKSFIYLAFLFGLMAGICCGLILIIIFILFK